MYVKDFKRIFFFKKNDTLNRLKILSSYLYHKHIDVSFNLYSYQSPTERCGTKTSIWFSLQTSGHGTTMLAALEGGWDFSAGIRGKVHILLAPFLYQGSSREAYKRIRSKPNKWGT